MTDTKIVKPSRPPNDGFCPNRLAFDEAYEQVKNNPNKQYETTGNQTPFKAIATKTSKGVHQGDKVIRFITGTEKGRAYKCCWGHITNCNRTYIDCYTKAL